MSAKRKALGLAYPRPEHPNKKPRKVRQTPAEKRRAKTNKKNKTDPRISLSPLYTVREDGGIWYGPKPGSRAVAALRIWQRNLTQEQWKNMNSLSPQCRACNGNTSQGHYGDEACQKACAYAKELKKCFSAKKKSSVASGAYQTRVVRMRDKLESDNEDDLVSNDEDNSRSDDDAGAASDASDAGAASDATNASPDTPSDQADAEQRALIRILKRHPRGVMLWLHDNNCGLDGEPKVDVEPMTVFFSAHREERARATKEQARLREEVKELQAQLQTERDGNQAAQNDVQRLLAQLQTERDGNQAAQNDVQRLRTQLQTERDGNQAAQNDVQRLRTQLQTERDGNQAAQNDVQRLRTQLQRKEAQLQTERNQEPKKN